MRIAQLVPLLCLACSEYDVAGFPDTVEPPTDTQDDPVAADPADPMDDPEIGDEEPPVLEDPPEQYVGCESVGLWTDQWWSSMPFTTAPDPVDAQGRAFFQPDFTMVDFSTALVPDEGHVPSGSDKVYRTTLWLDASGPRVFLDLQSDDGLWIWVDGTYVGHWGGDWQDEGCVNPDASCTEYVQADPVEITDQLHVGGNVLAVRLSNAVNNAYMGVAARCAED